VGLFPLVNPVGMSVFFLQLTENMKKKERKKLAFKVAKNSFLLLLLILFIGSYILKFFDVSLNAVNMAGGLLIAWSAMDSLNDKSSSPSKQERESVSEKHKNLVFFPLTIPFTTGPGAIAVTISLATHIENKLSLKSASEYSGVIIGILFICVLICICYSFSESIFKVIGKAGTQAITSLFALIILAVGIGVFWRGLEPLLFAVIHGL